LALEAGVTWREIASAWEVEEAAFRELRKEYLLYE
jgi:exo-beta-N-acetylmuramidase NamZ-like protein